MAYRAARLNEGALRRRRESAGVRAVVRSTEDGDGCGRIGSVDICLDVFGHV